MIKTNQALYTTLDIYLSAYLLLRGLRPTLDRRNNKVVISFVATSELYELLLQFNSNIEVPVADYVVAVKTLRGQMLSLMNSGN